MRRTSPTSSELQLHAMQTVIMLNNDRAMSAARVEGCPLVSRPLAIVANEDIDCC
jgi:hypothetical protein